MKAKLISLVLLIIPFTLSANQTLQTLGDILQYANPISAYVVAASEHKSGHFLVHLGSAMAVTGVSKMIGKYTHFKGSQRPNNGTYNGMPSGHTTAAWLPAAYIRTHSKRNYISPILYSTAIITGTSRVLAKKHTIAQVVASILISETIVYLNKKLNISFLDLRFTYN